MPSGFVHRLSVNYFLFLTNLIFFRSSWRLEKQRYLYFSFERCGRPFGNWWSGLSSYARSSLTSPPTSSPKDKSFKIDSTNYFRHTFFIIRWIFCSLVGIVISSRSSLGGEAADWSSPPLTFYVLLFLRRPMAHNKLFGQRMCYPLCVPFHTVFYAWLVNYMRPSVASSIGRCSTFRLLSMK